MDEGDVSYAKHPSLVFTHYPSLITDYGLLILLGPVGQCRESREILALQQFERRTAARRDKTTSHPLLPLYGPQSRCRRRR